jgi:hypothetical protein
VTHPLRPSRGFKALPFLLAALLPLSGPACSKSLERQPAVPRDAAGKPVSGRPEAARVDETARQREVVRGLEDENAHLSLQLLEREAQIMQLETRLMAQQRAMDDAVQEVVRLKAKHRSLETRAEAAAEIAEAEIALKAFHDQESTGARPELAKAEALVQRAAEEFGKQNFGGALYLVEQAKDQIRLGSMEPGDLPVTDSLEGEKPFAVPIPLTVTTRSNLREGPGQDFKVLTVLEQGTPITGLSSKGLWVRVEGKDGLSGWLKLNLVTAS